MTSSTTNFQAREPDKLKVFQTKEAVEVLNDLGGDDQASESLIDRINACLAHPESQTVGSFAAVIQQIRAELGMMSGESLEQSEEAVDWGSILAAADNSLISDDVADFTLDEIAAIECRDQL